jgi:hypothetical protein
MHPSEFIDEIKTRKEFSSDDKVADFLGLTQGRISQLRTQKKDMTARQLVSYIQKAVKKAEDRGCQAALTDPVPIKPIVEMYPIEPTLSALERRWKLLPTEQSDRRNQAIRSILESSKGIYFFYDSQGCAIYAGKTESLNLWREMNSAFNRRRPNHQIFRIQHPASGTAFSPAWETPIQPRKTVVYLYETACYFSAYSIAHPALISKLEALVIRAFCNNLSNTRMETF